MDYVNFGHSQASPPVSSPAVASYLLHIRVVSILSLNSARKQISVFPSILLNQGEEDIQKQMMLDTQNPGPENNPGLQPVWS